MIPHETVTAQILALADESPTKTIRAGGRLSELLKHHIPGFTPSQYGREEYPSLYSRSPFREVDRSWYGRDGRCLRSPRSDPASVLSPCCTFFEQCTDHKNQG